MVWLLGFFVVSLFELELATRLLLGLEFLFELGLESEFLY